MQKLTLTNIEFTELNLFSWHFKWLSIILKKKKKLQSVHVNSIIITTKNVDRNDLSLSYDRISFAPRRIETFMDKHWPYHVCVLDVIKHISVLCSFLKYTDLSRYSVWVVACHLASSYHLAALLKLSRAESIPGWETPGLTKGSCWCCLAQQGVLTLWSVWVPVHPEQSLHRILYSKKALCFRWNVQPKFWLFVVMKNPSVMV